MKKIFILLVLFIFSFNFSFAEYKITEEDKKIIKKIENILKNFSSEKKNILKQKIPNILEKTDKNSKNYFLISEIYRIILEDEKIFENSENIFKIEKVIDGDTVEYLKNGKKVRARLIGLDAPEATTTRFGYIEKYGFESKEKLQEFILGKNIFIEYDKSQGITDKYGRELVYIFLDGKNIGEEMIKIGFAKEYTYSKKYKYQEIFKDAEKQAKQNFLGIWENEKINYDSNFKIKGNINRKNQKLYHYYPGCDSYDKTRINLNRGEKYFDSIEQAEKFGWKRAENCK